LNARPCCAYCGSDARKRDSALVSVASFGVADLSALHRLLGSFSAVGGEFGESLLMRWHRYLPYQLGWFCGMFLIA